MTSVCVLLQTWEYGISLCEELAKFYKSRIMYKKLSDILVGTVTVCDMLNVYIYMYM